MRGRSYRRPVDKGYVRLVRDLRNSDADEFITEPHAQELHMNGAIVPINVGNDYPNSYKPAP